MTASRLLALSLLLLSLSTATAEDAITNSIPDGVVLCANPVFEDGLSIDLQSTIFGLFCTNGGTCRENPTVEAPCDCPDGYVGPHCEFQEADLPSECTLECFNEGVCTLGFRAFQQVRLTASLPDAQYCTCPEDKIGYQCEIDAEPCGSDYHCMHGGTCSPVRQPDGTVKEYCDCTTAVQGGVHYAGRFCQNEATSTCTADEDEHNGHMFCVNGGTCRKDR
jgi:EGF-like domain